MKKEKGIPYGRTHLRRMYDPKSPWYAEFPQPVEIGPGRIGWWESEVDEWLRKRPRKELPPEAPDEEQDDRKVHAGVSPPKAAEGVRYTRIAIDPDGYAEFCRRRGIKPHWEK